MRHPTSLRRSASALLIVAAFGVACGHIISAQRVYEPSLAEDYRFPTDRRVPVWPKARPKPMPTFSSNDRSRWATVRALVDDGTYAIGARSRSALYTSAMAPLGQLDPMQSAILAAAAYVTRVNSDHGIIREDGWESVDKVLDPSTMKYYSSKPPLLATLIAGLYWLLQRVTGWTLGGQPNEVVRTLLLLVNALPFAIYLWQFGRLVETWGHTDWGRLYVVTAGAFATLVGPFLITLNNHTLGTFSVMFAWLALLRISRHADGSQPEAPAWYHFLSAGFFAAFAVTNELPALAFAAAVFALLLWWYPGRTLLLALPPALVVAAAFFATNYAAMGTWRLAYSETDSVWYQYEGSHWRPLPEGQVKYGIDWARHYHREDAAEYARHVLVGHHGLFSLTPIWLLSVVAMVVGLFRLPAGPNASEAKPQAALPRFAQPMGLLLSVVVIGFYLYRTNNYGGWTHGLRWLMWLTPIWLTCLLPVADWLEAWRWGRRLGYFLLAVSVFSASYEPWNPWRHPWIYDVMEEVGWRGYERPPAPGSTKASPKDWRELQDVRCEFVSADGRQHGLRHPVQTAAFPGEQGAVLLHQRGRPIAQPNALSLPLHSASLRQKSLDVLIEGRLQTFQPFT
jgi:hypothetical protein